MDSILLVTTQHTLLWTLPSASLLSHGPEPRVLTHLSSTSILRTRRGVSSASVTLEISLCWDDPSLHDSCFAGLSPEAGRVLSSLINNLHCCRFPSRDVLEPSLPCRGSWRSAGDHVNLSVSSAEKAQGPLSTADSLLCLESRCPNVSLRLGRADEKLGPNQIGSKFTP